MAHSPDGQWKIYCMAKLESFESTVIVNFEFILQGSKFDSLALFSKLSENEILSRRWQARPPNFTPPKLTAYSKSS
jgi:hypothetical protein